MVWGSLGVALVGILFAAGWWRFGIAASAGERTDPMRSIWQLLRTAASIYQGIQIKIAVGVALGMGLVLGATGLLLPSATVDPWLVAAARGGGCILGALLALLTSVVSIFMGHEGSIHTATSARKGYSTALHTSYRAGAVGGMLTIGLGMPLVILLVMFGGALITDALLGFAAGSLLTMLVFFVGGGIYAEASSLGLEMVHRSQPEKVEEPPASLSRAGMGTDLSHSGGTAADAFSSVEIVTVAAIIGGLALGDMSLVVFALVVRGIGIIASLLGGLLIRTNDQRRNAMAALSRGLFGAAIVAIAGYLGAAFLLLVDAEHGGIVWFPVCAATTGVVLGMILDRLIRFFTAPSHQSVKGIGRWSRDGGTPLNVLSGISLGLEASAWAIVILALGTLFSSSIVMSMTGEHHLLLIFYNMSLIGLGMVALVGVMGGMNGFAVAASGAQQIATAAAIEKNARQVTSDLDAVGSMIGQGNRAVISLAGAFGAMSLIGLLSAGEIRGMGATLIAGVFIGGGVVVLITSSVLGGVIRVMTTLVNDARKVVADGVSDTTESHIYTPLIRRATGAMHRELLVPGVVIVVTPLVIGLLGGINTLVGFLIGVLPAAYLLGLSYGSMGGAWEHARRYIEDGHVAGKRSQAHQVACASANVGEVLRVVAAAATSFAIKAAALFSCLIAPLIRWIRPVGTNVGAEAMIGALVGIILIVAIGLINRRQIALTSEPRSTPALTSSKRQTRG